MFSHTIPCDVFIFVWIYFVNESLQFVSCGIWDFSAFLQGFFQSAFFSIYNFVVILCEIVVPFSIVLLFKNMDRNC